MLKKTIAIAALLAALAMPALASDDGDRGHKSVTSTDFRA